MTNKLQELVENIQATAQPTRKGRIALDKAAARYVPRVAQRLSEIEAEPKSPKDGWRIPPTYIPQYERLIERGLDRQAQAFWNKWAFKPKAPKSAAEVEHERRITQASGALSRVQNGNPLKRRI